MARAGASESQPASKARRGAAGSAANAVGKAKKTTTKALAEAPPVKARAVAKTAKAATKTAAAPAKTTRKATDGRVAAAPKPARAGKTVPAPAPKPEPKPKRSTRRAAAKAPVAPTKASVAPAKASVAPAKASVAPTKASVAPAKASVAPAKASVERTPGFPAKTLIKLQRILEEERGTYLRQARDLAAEAEALASEREPGDTQFDEESGEGDTLNIERERDLALSASARQAVEEIDRALQRMDAGTYGVCERCGKKISVARLEALPYAALCIDCKSREERRR